MADFQELYSSTCQFLLPPIVDSWVLTRGQQYVLVDARLAELDSARIALSIACNSLVSALQLAPEVLGLIFRQHIHNMVTEGDDGELHPTWYLFSHVCSRWRSVTLGNPSLWSHVSFRYPLWLKETLKQAKMVPVVVHISHHINISNSAVFVTVQHTLAETTHRIRCLHMEGLDIDGMEIFLHAITPVPAPILDSLSLLATAEGRLFNIIPKHLFGGITPRLRCVHVGSCSIPFGSSILMNLVHLHLDRSTISRASEHETSLSDLLAVFATSPLLETLHLDSISPTHVDIDPPRPVTFSRLEYIHVLDNASSVSIILNNIRIPSFTTVSVDCTGGDFFSAAKAFGVATSDHPPKKCLSLHIERSKSPRGEQLCITSRAEKAACARAIWSLVFLWRESEVNQVELLVSYVVRSLDISALLRLDFHIASDVTGNMWIDLFTDASQLEDVAVSGNPIRGLLNILSLVGSSENDVLFPRLKHLIIIDVVFDDTIKNIILEVVRERQTRGSAVSCLDIKSSKHFQSDWKLEFEMYVSSVYWDGHNQSQLPTNDNRSDNVSSLDEYSDPEENISSAYGSEYASVDGWDYQD